jgi:diguanylate cyclase (GGDEF)-like protein
MYQLLELLAVVSSYPDVNSAAQGAAERAAQTLEAEVAAVVVGGRVVASIGFPADAVPTADLLALARRELDELDVPGVGRCQTLSTSWGGDHPGHLILARWGEENFSVQERSIVHGMARLLELTLTMLRTLEAEHAMRRRSERQATENVELMESLRQRQRLLEYLLDVQRAISLRRPLDQILDMITVAAHELLGDEIVGLWLRDALAPDHAVLVAEVGIRVDPGKQRPCLPLAEAGAAGAAMLTDDIAVRFAYADASPLLVELTDDRLQASMAAPVHDNGAVTGSLLVGTRRPDRTYQPAELQTLRAFAQHVSLALNDANTVERMFQAFHDSLTGLANRGLFLERLTEQLHSHLGERIALLFLDLDRFKDINDSLGHAAGDALLKTTADRLRSSLREHDVAARFGGDEFAIMLWPVRTTEDAVRIAERILRALRAPMVIAGRRLEVNASVGIALSTRDLSDPMELMRRADVAMYQAKRHGRGRCGVFTDEMLISFPADQPAALPEQQRGVFNRGE